MDVTEAVPAPHRRRGPGGDPDAWETLYRRVYPRLFAYARRRLGTDEQAEDAVSEAMTRAMHRIDDVHLDPCRPRRLAVRDRAQRRARDLSRRAAHDADRPPGAAAQAGAQRRPAPDPPDRVVGDEERRLLRLAFGRLTEDDQEVLEPRVVAGLDAQAVGEVTGRRAGAVRMAQSRALARLRVEYEGLVR